MDQQPKPKLLDLFCGAGGAGMGYHLAGFDVTGVDINPQPLYPFPFIQADALTVNLEEYDVIHASPPCQGYTTMNNRWGSETPQLISVVRDYLNGYHKPYVIENVVGARRDLQKPISIHGGMFNLDVYRPRLFESNMPITAPGKKSRPKNTVAVYGKNDGRYLWDRADGTTLRVASLEEARRAMEMPWSDWYGCTQAVPPAYTKWIGGQLMHLLPLYA